MIAVSSFSRLLANVIAPSAVWNSRRRAQLLRQAGVRIGRGSKVNPGIAFIGDPTLLTIGEDVFVNSDLLVGSNAPITIADGASIGPRVTLVPTTHEVGPSARRAGEVTAAPIVIGAGAWLGAGVTVISGVTIGAGAIVAAGAVVAADLEPNGLYGGVPAKHIKELT